MLTIAVAAQKGGAGKTTVTVHLAVAAMLANERVAIVDTDPQRTALAWAQTRGLQTPMVAATTRVDEAKREALSDGYTVLLIDTPPVAAATTTAYLRAADFVLVPLRPSAFDLTTLDQTLALVRAAQTAGAIVLNACPARAPEIRRRGRFVRMWICRSRLSNLETVAPILVPSSQVVRSRNSTRKAQRPMNRSALELRAYEDDRSCHSLSSAPVRPLQRRYRLLVRSQRPRQPR